MRRRVFLTRCLLAFVLPRWVVAGERKREGAATARDQAARYLCRRQNVDGSWPSKIYGAFKDGHALTPLIFLALTRHGAEFSQSTRAKAIRWLLASPDSIAEVFPVHNASWLLQAGAIDQRLGPLRDPLRDRLHHLQIGTAQGWKPDHHFYGGWSYAPSAPAAAGEVPPFQQPNLSATVLAVAGLSAAGLEGRHPALQKAAGFIRHCQNIAPKGAQPSKFDDGGFFQLQDDPARNKAGTAGQDDSGRKRQRSYTSSTADGLSGLLLCGCGRDDPRVRAAVAWLDENLDLNDVPDLRHYAAHALASSLAQLRAIGMERPKWRRAIAASLLKGQRPDGSWHNDAGEMRENDPLVATALGLLGLLSELTFQGESSPGRHKFKCRFRVEKPLHMRVRSLGQLRVFSLRSAGKFSSAWHPFSQASLRFSLNQDTKQTGEAWRRFQP